MSSLIADQRLLDSLNGFFAIKGSPLIQFDDYFVAPSLKTNQETKESVQKEETEEEEEDDDFVFGEEEEEQKAEGENHEGNEDGESNDKENKDSEEFNKGPEENDKGETQSKKEMGSGTPKPENAKGESPNETPQTQGLPRVAVDRLIELEQAFKGIAAKNKEIIEENWTKIFESMLQKYGIEFSEGESAINGFNSLVSKSIQITKKGRFPAFLNSSLFQVDKCLFCLFLCTSGSLILVFAFYGLFAHLHSSSSWIPNTNRKFFEFFVQRT